MNHKTRENYTVHGARRVGRDLEIAVGVARKEFTVNYLKYIKYTMDKEPPPETFDNDHPESGRVTFLLPLHFMSPMSEGKSQIK